MINKGTIREECPLFQEYQRFQALTSAIKATYLLLETIFTDLSTKIAQRRRTIIQTTHLLISVRTPSQVSWVSKFLANQMQVPLLAMSQGVVRQWRIIFQRRQPG